MFILQNRDFTELYWNSEYGWVDRENADCYSGTELDEDYCIELMETRQGRWVKFEKQSIT